ncbi:MAG: cob(I)yrinic acid a,c-diamide adenosyltransferase [Polyangiales bacterium]
MKIYTKTGDSGETGLFGGARLSKAALRVDSYGQVDELNSVIGLALSQSIDESVATLLRGIQSELFQLGAELATVPGKLDKLSIALIDEPLIQALEMAIDRYEEQLEPLKNFVLPGGTQSAAALHYARCVCRRAERRVVELMQTEDVRELVVVYLNRLSDLLFVLARFENHRVSVADIPWIPKK